MEMMRSAPNTGFQGQSGAKLSSGQNPTRAPHEAETVPNPVLYTLAPLPYDYAALEPAIDSETLKLHHDAGRFVRCVDARLRWF